MTGGTLVTLSDEELLAAAAISPQNPQLSKHAARIQRGRELLATHPELGAEPAHIVQIVKEAVEVLLWQRRWMGCGGGMGQGVGELSACSYCGALGPPNKRKRSGHNPLYGVELLGIRMCGKCQQAAGAWVLGIARTVDVEIGERLGGEPPRAILRRWRRCGGCQAAVHEGEILDQRYREPGGMILENFYSGRCPRCGWEAPDGGLNRPKWEMLPMWAVFAPLRCPRAGGRWDDHDFCACHHALWVPGQHLRDVAEKVPTGTGFLEK